MPVCLICNIEKVDLTRHVHEAHQMTADEYKKQYQTIIVDPLVEEKRRHTCEILYGDPNYKNEEAKKLSNELFDGGHPLSDPIIRAKACETKQKLYGDPGFTNRAKAKETCLARYGVDNVANIPGVKERSVKTLIARYGRVINYDHVPFASKEELFDLHVNHGMTLGEIGQKFNVTAEGVSYWMKKHSIPVTRRIVIPKTKEYISTKEIVEIYFKKCVELSKVLSFSEYGKADSDKNNQRMKRLFNSGRPHSHLKEELFQVALLPDKWSTFFNKLS